MLSLFIALLLAGPALPNTHLVRITLDPRGTPVKEVAITLRPIDKRPEGAVEPARQQQILNAESPLSLPLAPGNWELRVDTPDVWHAAQFFLVPETSGTEVEVPVWPRATLQGKVGVDSDLRPDELTLRFESTALSAAPPNMSGQIRCPIQDHHFSCAMPAGTYRLRVKPRGFIARYFAGVTLDASETKDLGIVEFKQGQAITGHVALPARSMADVTEAVVTAVPEGTGRQGLLAIHARAEKDGFFHLDGVGPGAYVVNAVLQRSLASPPVELVVREGSEAELTEPLLLNQPRKISLQLVPSAAFDGTPWHVRLYRSEKRHLDEITESRASTAGAWDSPSLPPGPYAIEVGSLSGGKWHREEILLGSDDYRKSIVLTSRHLNGRVTLGDRPLQAALAFSGSSGFLVDGMSDADGHFAATLPNIDDQLIAIKIHSDAPWIQRKVLTKAPTDKETLDIRLPDSVVTGEVVDATGKPVAHALVTLSAAEGTDGLVQPGSAEDGSFEIHGLAPATYTAIASDFLQESEPVTLDVTGDNPPKPLHLVLHDMKQLYGRVLASRGPVPAAQIQARAINVAQTIVENRETDGNGEFTAALPFGTQNYEMIIAPPGFAFIISSGVLSKTPALIHVDQSGGTLVVDTAKGDVAVLVHNGGTWPALAVANQWPSRRRQLADEGLELVLPAMESGPYEACTVASGQYQLFRATAGQSGGRCVRGFLPPYGSLTLDLRSH